MELFDCSRARSCTYICPQALRRVRCVGPKNTYARIEAATCARRCAHTARICSCLYEVYYVARDRDPCHCRANPENTNGINAGVRSEPRWCSLPACMHRTYTHARTIYCTRFIGKSQVRFDVSSRRRRVNCGQATGVDIQMPGHVSGPYTCLHQHDTANRAPALACVSMQRGLPLRMHIVERGSSLGSAACKHAP